MRRILVSLLLFLLTSPVFAELEVLPLRHRTVDQVLPTLQAFVEPGGALQGMSGQIIVRASAQNIAELRRVLESIDKPARRLLVSVTQDAATASRTSGAGLGIGERRDHIGVTVIAGERGSASEERIAQQVQALEGSPATIATGTAVPTSVTTYGPGGAQTTMGYAQFDTGFMVTPRLSGDRVFLEIAPQRASLGPAGSGSVQRVATTVSGRLGEWIPLGGVTNETSMQGSSFGAGGLRGSSGARNASGVWVRVEALP